MLVRDLCDPRLRGITLTEVKMDDDLRHAVAGFRSASGFIRREIGKSLGLRYTPELDFQFRSRPRGRRPYRRATQRVCAQGLNKISLPSPIFAS
jgi:ribosome-binding factor A